jgi:hypothetical protein
VDSSGGTQERSFADTADQQTHRENVGMFLEYLRVDEQDPASLRIFTIPAKAESVIGSISSLTKAFVRAL